MRLEYGHGEEKEQGGSERGRGCARNDRGCVMGGVSNENGAKDCAVEAAAPLPTPELRGAEQQRVGLTLGAAQL